MKKSIAGVIDVDAVDNPDHIHEDGVELHSWIGIALVLGFTFMLLVDQIGGAVGHAHGSNHSNNTGNYSN